ncbi:MAG: capsular biosynthesis protein [Steroidobacteraceae bacterium]
MKQVLSYLTARKLRLAVVAAPWILAALYLFVFAADRYVSESIVTVRQNGAEGAVGFNLTSLLGVSVPASLDDEKMLEAYILSMDILRKLDQKLGLQEAFNSPRADFVFRLGSSPSQEQFLDYYRSRVEVVVEEDSGLLRIRTQGFSPEAAAALNREMLALSEGFINESSHRLAREQMEFAESELRKARSGVDRTRDAVLRFQRAHDILDPVAQAEASSGLTAQLQAELSKQEAELKGLLGYLDEDAYQVQALRAQIAGMRAQLATEGRRGVEGPKGASLNVLAGEYQELLADLEFATETYKLALTGVETARIESTRKLKSLVLVQTPMQPESAEYPRRFYLLFALFMGLALVYGIARLIVATIEDHLE